MTVSRLSSNRLTPTQTMLWGDFSNAATGTYTDSDGTWKYVTFTASGTLTVTKTGYFDVLVIGGGGAGQTYGGNGGRIMLGIWKLTAGSVPVVVGAGATGGTDTGAGQIGGYSSLDAPRIVGGGGGSGWNYIQGAMAFYPAGANYKDGYPSSITGSSITYGRGGESGQSSPIANRGMGSLPTGAGSSGVVIVRTAA